MEYVLEPRVFGGCGSIIREYGPNKGLATNNVAKGVNRSRHELLVHSYASLMVRRGMSSLELIIQLKK